MTMNRCKHLLIMMLALSVGSSCAPTVGDGLTASELAALRAAVNGPMGVAQAIAAAQSAAMVAQANGQTAGGDATFGQCPEITTNFTLDETLAAELTIDFGDGCTPWSGTDDYACSGSATGTYTQSDSLIDVEFEALTCNDQALNGTTSVIYSLISTGVAVTGAWDIEYSDEGGTYGIAGAGSGEHITAEATTVLSTFDGTVSSDDGEWSLEIDGLSITYASDTYWLPSAGEVTLSGSDIRTIVIRFTEDTPTTGEVEISIDGSPFVPLDVAAF